MNTITLIVAILTLWLVMGLGFLSEYSKLRRQGKTLIQSFGSGEGILFLSSILLSLLYLFTRI
jgi:hypothetical protein